MKSDLRNKVLKDYPLPIGIFYAKLLADEYRAQKNSSHYQLLFFSLIDLFEILVRFLSVLVLANYIQEGAFSEDHNTMLWRKFDKKLSLGDWLEIFRETIRMFQDDEARLFIPELFTCYFFKKSNKLIPTKTAKLFDEFVNLRNKKKGHSLSLSANEYKELCTLYIPKIEEILSTLDFLTDYRMVSPIDSRFAQIER